MKVLLRKSQAKEPFSFAFVNDKGKTLLKSENYKAKKSARNGIASVQNNCQNEQRYELKESKNGKFFFNLKAANGQIVGTSTMFASTSERSAAITLIKDQAVDVQIQET
ncbi:MAG: YegP family protein [Gammaproteobacteria bacterium]|nr:YegP family protein [Gammaproteobacteria bacterium]